MKTLDPEKFCAALRREGEIIARNVEVGSVHGFEAMIDAAICTALARVFKAAEEATSELKD